MHNEIIAFCYIHQSGDERNKCLLTDQHLDVIIKGESHLFPLAYLNNILFSIKKLWLPLVAGGIIASLSTVALFKGLGDPWVTFISLLAGLFLFYYGNQGTQTMTIISGSDQTHLFIVKLSPNLKSFSNFVLKYKNPDPAFRRLYLAIDLSQKDNYILHGIKASEFSNEGKIKCLTREQIRKIKLLDHQITIEIDPLKINSEIRYEWDENGNDLFPFVYGTIPHTAISK